MCSECCPKVQMKCKYAEHSKAKNGNQNLFDQLKATIEKAITYKMNISMIYTGGIFFFDIF